MNGSDTAIETTAEAEEAAVLPRIREVHTDPNREAPCDETLPAALKQDVTAKSPARWAYERLILYIQNFEKQLDAQHEVAMGFTGGEAGVIRIEGMGYFDPDLVTFYGRDPGGTRTQLIQHVTQLNVLLRALPKNIDQPEATRIGFQLGREIEGEAPEDAPQKDDPQDDEPQKDGPPGGVPQAGGAADAP